MTEYKCCENPDYVKAWTLCFPFKSKICLNCGELLANSHPIIEWIFEHFIVGIWFGISKIDTKNLTEEQIEKLNDNFN